MLQNLHECSGEKLKDLNGEDAPDWLMEHHGFPVITKSDEGNDIVCQQVRSKFALSFSIIPCMRIYLSLEDGDTV